MTTKDEALIMALEALEECRRDPRLKYEHPYYDKTITAIRVALAEQPAQQQEHWNTVFNAVSDAIGKCKSASGMHRSIDAVVNAVQITHDWMGTDTSKPAQQQEPVARVIDDGTSEGSTEWIPFANRMEPLEVGDLLYTSPPANANAGKPWVGLTEEEKTEIRREHYARTLPLMDAVEAKLREKNEPLEKNA